MREYKFRGERVDTGEWIYGYLVPRELLEDPDYLSPLWIATGFENVCMAVDKETVGQFTGLNDKNGKEIYEGDILKEPVLLSEKGETINSQVIWSNGRFIANGTIGARSSANSEIIGNIHENPELLND